MSFIQGIRRDPWLLVNFRHKLIFYGDELLAPRPTTKLEDHPFSVVCYFLLNVFAAILHAWRPSPSSTRHAVVTRDPPNMAPITAASYKYLQAQKPY
jgi:hypothetical protein